MHRLPRTRYRDDEPTVPSRVIILVDVTSGIIQSTPVTFPTHEGTALVIRKVNIDERRDSQVDRFDVPSR